MYLSPLSENGTAQHKTEQHVFNSNQASVLNKSRAAHSSLEVLGKTRIKAKGQKNKSCEGSKIFAHLEFKKNDTVTDPNLTHPHPHCTNVTVVFPVSYQYQSLGGGGPSCPAPTWFSDPRRYPPGPLGSIYLEISRSTQKPSGVS